MSLTNESEFIIAANRNS